MVSRMHFARAEIQIVDCSSSSIARFCLGFTCSSNRNDNRLLFTEGGFNISNDGRNFENRDQIAETSLMLHPELTDVLFQLGKSLSYFPKNAYFLKQENSVK